jgi:hypothetical protein
MTQASFEVFSAIGRVMVLKQVLGSCKMDLLDPSMRGIWCGP